MKNLLNFHHTVFDTNDRKKKKKNISNKKSKTKKDAKKVFIFVHCLVEEKYASKNFYLELPLLFKYWLMKFLNKDNISLIAWFFFFSFFVDFHYSSYFSSNISKDIYSRLSCFLCDLFPLVKENLSFINVLALLGFNWLNVWIYWKLTNLPLRDWRKNLIAELILHKGKI